MKRIDSLANPKIKWTASLHRRSAREREGAFIAEGTRLVEMASSSDFDPVLCLVTERAAASPRVKKIIESFEARGTDVFITPDSVYRKASATETPQGILAVIRQRRRTLDSLPGETSFIAVLDSIQDPGNAGTILRSADAAGCTALVALDGTVDLFSDKAVRSSMGSIFYLPTAENIVCEDFLAFVKKRGIELFVTTPDDSAPAYYDADLSHGAAFVFGSEGGGAREALINSSQRISIPMAGATESLNVASAAAIVLFESLRQRRNNN